MSIPLPRLLPLAALLLPLTLSTAPGARAADRPPTVDPTYGLPLPNPTHATALSSKADWIWAGRPSDNQTIFLRRTFSLTSVPKTATLYLTADDFFTLFVNDKQVDQSQADLQDINVWQHVHQVNVAPYLKAGTNVLAVQVVNAAGEAGFVARLETPGQTPIETDAGWKVSTNAALAAGWTGAAYDDAAWRPATVVAPLTGGVWAGAGGLVGWPGYDASAPYLAHLTLPFAVVAEIHPGAGRIAGADGLAGHAEAILTVTPPPTAAAADPPSLLLDFGKEIAGRVSVDPLTDGAVQIGTGESPDEAVKSPWHGPHHLSLVAGTKAYTPYSAFRYVRLVFPAGQSPVRLRVAMDHKYYPVQYRGSFACSDPVLTHLWYTGAYTAHLCMQEDIWDAPKRDRARWVGDLHVSGEVINNVFADKFLMEQTLTRLRDDAQGGKPDTEIANDHVNDIPGYSAAWICCLADFHRHVGDTAFLAKQHDPLLSLLEYMRGDLDEQGMFANKHGHWPYVDWSPDFDGDHPPARATTQMFYVKAAREAAFLLREMGDTANADKTAAWADALTDVARQKLPDAATNTYGNRLQENAMAVYSGVATPAQTDAIYRTVLAPDSPAWDKTGKMLGNNPVISPYYGNYVIQAMSLAGHNADTERVLRDYWGGMLAEGATTFWEGYDPKWPKAHFHEFLQADNVTGTNASLCHGWSAGPTNWLTERVLGIRPTSGGFATAEIAPDLGDLQWAQGTVPTPRGPLQVRAERQDGKMKVSLTLPPGVRASVAGPGTQKTLTGPGKYTLTGIDSRPQAVP